MRTSGDCGDRWTQPVCLVYLGLALLRVPPKEGNSLKRSLMIEWYLPLRAVSFPVLDSPLFFWNKLADCSFVIWPLLQPQHPEAAGVCLSIGRAASLVPWQPSLFVGTTGGLWCSWFWLLHHRGAGSLNRVTFGAAPSAVGQSFFGTNWRVAVFVRLAASSPSPEKWP